MSEARSIRVLLVDQDGDDARRIQQLVTDTPDLGLEVDWARDCESCLELLPDGEYDACAVVGHEPALELLGAARRRGFPIPVIVLDPHARRDIQHEVLERGAAAYLSVDELTAGVFQQELVNALERLWFEEDVIRREATFRLALEATGLGAWEYDVETGERRWDARTQEIFGVDVEGPVPPEIWDALTEPEERADERAFCAAASDPDAPGEFDLEMRIVRPDGVPRWVKMSGMALFAGEGEFRHCVRIVGTVEDITVKKHAGQVERLLVEAGREFALSLDLEETMSNIAHVGALAIGDLCVIELLEDGGRQRVEVAVRHEEDEPIAQWFRERPALEHPESTEMRALATRQPVLLTNVDAEYVETLRLGEEALALLRERGPVSVMTLPILGSEEPLGTMLFLAIGRENAFDPQSLALATQMTRRAALHVENAILYEQAQQALRMRDELQRIVAHDLRDPLNAISLSAGLMARLIDSGRYEKLDAALDNQRKAITSMKHLITDLLCAAKLEVGHLTIHPRPTPCVEVVKDVVELYELTAEEKSVALERELPDDLPPVQADPPRLQQVLANLVGNAVEHTPPGGRVRIGARHTDSMVQFEVSDTGPGISPEDQQHVFDRFWKKEGDGAGAGLGLWIAHEIVDLHGGDLCVSSALGAGTTFRFTLPVATRE